MYTFGTNYPGIYHYKDSDEFRNISGALLWQDEKCCMVEESPKGITISWNSSNEYLPIEFTYSFIEEIGISVLLEKDIKIKNNITYVTFKLPIKINDFLNNFNFN